MKNKIVGILISTLLIMTAAFPISGNILEKNITKNSHDRKTLYVGGSGPGNYSDINSAIYDANNGDTIFVYNGTYFGEVYVDKSINLIGEDRNNTVIDGMDYMSTVYFLADYINISGFTLKGAAMGEAGIMMNSNYNNVFNNKMTLNDDYDIFLSSNNTIRGNIINSNEKDSIGIYMENAHDNYILENTISLHGSRGIFVALSCRNTISDNNISYNSDGIYLWPSSNNNTISDNKFISNSEKSINLRDSNDNIIVANNISYTNNYGIYLQQSKRNIIKENDIYENKYGIYAYSDATNNSIYHNNMINNIDYNGYDIGNSTWDDNYPSGGNYWDNYNGTDDNNDGIGDIPHDIAGGSSQDLYPLMYPWGENPPVANYTYIINGGTVTFNASSSYDRDGEIVDYRWNFGGGNALPGKEITYKFCEKGTYNVTLSVQDDDGYFGKNTKTINITVDNQPPNIPLINGPLSGRPNIMYSYMFVSKDPDNDDVYYEILWGDGTTTGWIGPYDSDKVIIVNHSWSSKGKYIIAVRVRDFCKVTTEWVELEITMPRDKAINNLFLRFLENYPFLYQLLQMMLQRLGLQT